MPVRPACSRLEGWTAAGLFLLLAATILSAGCAAPGAPRPPSELVPEPVSDLQAHQTGKAVVLHFTLPRHATDGKSLAGPPRVEIYREFHAAGKASEPETAVPSTPTLHLNARQLAGDMIGDTVSWADTFAADQFQGHQGQRIVYRLRTAAGKSDWSALSKAAEVTLATPPESVRKLTATAGSDGVELRWQVPAPDSSPTPQSFLVYRTELGSGGGAAGAPAATGATTGNSYRDSAVEPGQSYRYTVRAVARVNGEEVESADSEPVVVHVRAMRPAAPEGLTAIPVRRPNGSPEVDLSWEIGSEANLAGYNVYRSGPAGGRGVRLNAKVLAASAFRDTTVTPGRSYAYTVTAVDPTGNESKASAPATVSVPKAGGGPR